MMVIKGKYLHSRSGRRRIGHQTTILFA